MEVTRYVLGFAFNMSCSEVLLIHKARPAWQAGRLNGIGGHIEGEESTRGAMAREMKEETGLDTHPHDWSHFCTMRGDDFEVHCFHTRVPGGYLSGWEQVTDECPALCSVARINAGSHNTQPNLRWLVPMAREHALNGGSILEIIYP